jgi:hypothetical protein
MQDKDFESFSGSRTAVPESYLCRQGNGGIVLALAARRPLLVCGLCALAAMAAALAILTFLNANG